LNEEELKNKFQEDLTMLLIKFKLTRNEDERSLINKDIENLKITYQKELVSLRLKMKNTISDDGGKRHR